MYKEVLGDLIAMTKKGGFDVVVHGCNCFCTMGAGIAPLMAEAFGCDNFIMEADEYKGDINKLGSIDYEKVKVSLVITDVFVVNAYTQYGFGRNHESGSDIPLDYDALRLCMRKINHIFKGSEVGLPKIGAGLGGGDWELIKQIIQQELVDCNVTVVVLPQNSP